MKNIMRLLIATPIIILFISCSASTNLISRMGHSERNDVFTEVPAGGAVPSGYADVVIRASIKRPSTGYYILEPKRPLNYPFLVNIDGQAVVWKVEGHEHSVSEYVDGKTNYDPEAGEGIKYILEKKVRLVAGSHKVFFGLPDEQYDTTADILVISGGSYVLEFKPDYRYKTVPTRIPTFLNGVDKFEVLFKETVVQDR